MMALKLPINVFKYDVGGSLPTSYAKTQTKLADLSNQLNTKLQNATETVNIKDAYAETIKQLSGDKIRKFGTNEEIKNSIKGLGKELIDAVGNVKDISVPDAQLWPSRRCKWCVGFWNSKQSS